jgi:hypothetical protein
VPAIEKTHLYPEAELVVLNCWGKEVFRSRNYRNTWSASELPSGIYFYQVSGPGSELIKGWVEVIK